MPSGLEGGLPPLLPPLIKSRAVSEVTPFGTMIVSQCCQSVRLTSFSVRHVWDFMSMT